MTQECMCVLKTHCVRVGSVAYLVHVSSSREEMIEVLVGVRVRETP